MKLFITSIFLICSTLIFCQNKTRQIKNPDDNNSPKFRLVVDTTNYPLDDISMAKIDPGWIERIEVLKNKDKKDIYGNKNGLVLIYPKKSFVNNALMIIKIQNDTLICFAVDSYPEFNYDNVNNTIEALEKYFRQNYQMPQLLFDNGYIGTIYVNFIVENDGHLTNIAIKKGIDKCLDESVRDFVKKMPPWIPARIKSENVRYKFIFPVDIKWLYGEIK